MLIGKIAFNVVEVSYILNITKEQDIINWGVWYSIPWCGKIQDKLSHITNLKEIKIQVTGLQTNVSLSKLKNW